ncbi:MAG: DUF4838 domain-containing protein [Victivallaceae bacterium]|nr:DUF4838 domain-containing protein [Victivallaceae bacterium]
MIKALVLLMMLGGTLCSLAGTVTVNPQKAVIVLSSGAGKIKQFAAAELAKHLKLITGQQIPVVKGKAPAGKYAFMIGVSAPGGTKKMAPEQAVFTVTAKKSYFNGDDLVGRGRSLEAIAYSKYSRTGTLFAVYLFLEKELGVKWFKPGDDGIVFAPSKQLKLQAGTISWTPKLTMREIRPGYNKKTARDSVKAPKEFQLSVKQRTAKRLETQIWLKRMKMGRSQVFGYGHAFTRWWNKYGKAHPEYFALNAKGQRAPYHASKPDRIKLCVSNPEVHKLIVADFVKRGRGKVVNTCENDSGNYCECKKCRALDATMKGEKFDKDLTDRYIWFANSVQRLARKQVPGAQAIMYAYSVYRYPPRKVKVDDGVILGFVPKLLADDLDAYYQAWAKAGAKKLFLRPNDMHIDPGLPMGFEKRMFDNFQTCMKYGAFGTDYDSIHNFWPVSGIANYIIARAIADPGKSFDYWENEYCSTYGPAADEVKKYYHYWRKNIFEKKLIPDREMIEKKGRYGNFRRGLMWNLYNYYSDADFDKTDALLKAGLNKKLTPAERQRLELLLLANQHARLAYEAMRAKYKKPQDAKKLAVAANRLLDFRKNYREKLDFNWEFLFGNEATFGDVCGMVMTKTFKGLRPLKKLSLKWFFKIDQKDIGLKQQWQNSPWGQIDATWDTLYTDTFWEKAKCHPALHKQLQKYDGIGWYATRIKVDKKLQGKKLFLVFGAVDESCWIFVDGKPAGEHLFKKPDDWKTPFSIRIDKELDFEQKSHTVVVRVRDVAGAGGIWQPVYLAVED